MSDAVAVVVDAPRHAGMQACLDYRHDEPLPAGTLVRVPLGRRQVPGIVWGAASGDSSHELKAVAQVLSAQPPLSAAWRALVDFAAGYYQRALGELALSVLPPELRRLDATQLTRRVARVQRPAAAGEPEPAPELTDEQRSAAQAIEAGGA
jgi:primosomal protein N' (replication factor Y)